MGRVKVLEKIKMEDGLTGTVSSQGAGEQCDII